jgi:pyruvate,water dikinase
MAQVRIWDANPGYDFDEQVDLKDSPSWFLDGTHCVPPWTPMFAWFWNRYCCHGLKYCCDRFSLPRCKGWEMRYKDGMSYLTFHIVRDEEEVKQREVKFREAMRPLLEDFDGIWKGHIDEMMGLYNQLRSLDLDKASNFELLYHLYDLIAMYRRMWEIHFVGMYAAYGAWLLLETLCKDWFGIKDQSPEFQQLLVGFDNKVYQVDKRLWEFSQDAINKGLADIFLTTEPREIVAKLEQIEAGREWLKVFREFLWEDGWRMQRMAEINEPTWIEDPAPPISAIKGFLAKGGGFVLEEVRARLAQEREKAVEAMMQRVPEGEKEWFLALIRVAQKASSYSEEHNHYLDLYSHALIRRGMLGIGRRLVQAGTIDQPEDTFYLNPDEVERVMLAPEFHDLRYIVSRRRKEWEEWLKKEAPPVITTRSSIPEAVEKDLLPSMDPIALKTSVGEVPEVIPELKADLFGLCGSPGVAEGPARVILSYEELHKVQEGDILVAPATSPPWTPVFSLIKGVVVDFGGTLCHAAIIGREFGIPAIVNAGKATSMIQTGDRVRVDGDHAAVFILEKAQP